jgi:hypothetical protein
MPCSAANTCFLAARSPLAGQIQHRAASVFLCLHPNLLGTRIARYLGDEKTAFVERLLLVSINFTAVAAGAAGVSLASLILEDSPGNAIDAQSIDGRVEVNAGSGTPVPEPATVFRIGSGLAVGLRRTRRRRVGSSEA